MGMNRARIGREYPPTTHTVDASAAERYARAINEDNPCFLDASRPGGVVAPPLFGVVIAARAVAQAVGDRELDIDFPYALHGEQDMEFLAPLRAGDEISTSARIEAIEAKETGETLTVRLELRSAVGEPVQRHRFVLFVRARTGKSAREREKGAPRGGSSAGSPTAVVVQRMDLDQARRYAEASGDRTPIHLDESVAKKAGLPGVIVHGLCTLAFASKAATDSLCAGDPRRLRRVGVRFARPVRPGQELTTRFSEAGRENGSRVFVFDMRNSEDVPVLTAGICEVRP